MADEIKSALEIAMEKASKLGKLTPEEALEQKWAPEGERIAALYLRGETDLPKALSQVEPAGRQAVFKGLVGVLLANLGLPRTETDANAVAKVLKALPLLCSDAKAIETVVQRVMYVLDQYTKYGGQQMQQARQQYKQRFVQALQQQLQREGRQVNTANLDVESMPEFQGGWRAQVASIEQQYVQHLDDYKKQARDLILAKPKLK